MTNSIAFWTDSTYMQLQDERIFELADELNFPLASFQCSCGAGLTSKGNESNGAGYHAADNVVIEMGYNDSPNLSEDVAVMRMRTQTVLCPPGE